MNPEKAINKLKDFGIFSRQQYYSHAFSRNIGIFSPGEQERLSRAKVAIPGMGGVGGGHLINLVRTGFGNFHLSDFDHFEPVNINRQSGAKVSSFGKPKLEVMIEESLNINPYLEIKPFSSGLTKDNIRDFLQDTDVVLDGLDFFQFEIRRLLFNTALKMGIPVVTAGPLGYSSAILVFTPEAMGFDAYFDVGPDVPEEDKYLRFAMGLAPSPTHISYMDLCRVDLRGCKGPSLSIACQLCSALAVTEAARIVLGKPGLKPVPCYFQFDPFLQKFRKGRLKSGNRSIRQKLKIWYVKNYLLAAASRGKPNVPQKPQVFMSGHPVNRSTMEYLVKAAIQAPSGDNAQPWKFSISSEDREPAVSLFIDPSADNSFFNVRQIATIISCGAAIENICISSSDLGIEPKVDYLPDSGQENLMARIFFSRADILPDSLAAGVWSRCTNRRPFSRHPVPGWVHDDLLSRIKSLQGANLHMLTARNDIKTMSRLVYLADRIRTEHKGLHEHFSSMIRFSRNEAEKTRDGLPLKNLEAGVSGEVFLRITRPWPVMNIFNKMGMGRMVAMHSAQGILSSGAVGLVSVTGMNTKDFLLGGQALQRIWLTLEYNGLQMQPMTAITLFWLRWLFDGPDSFSEKHVRLLGKVWGDFQTLFPDVDFHSQGLVMLFRTGYGPGIRHRTLRKQVGDFLVE